MSIFERCKQVFCVGVLTATSFLLGVVFASYLIIWLKNPLFYVFSKYILIDADPNLSTPQRNAINYLIAQNKIISIGDIFSHLSDFYTLLVAF